MKIHYLPSLLSHFILATILLLTLNACDINSNQTALLATGQAQQATQIALLATRSALDLQSAQLTDVQAQQATQIAGQATRFSNVDHIAQLSTLQAQQATVQAQLATQIAVQATRFSNTSQIDQLTAMQAQQATQIADHMSWISNLSTRVPPRTVVDNPTATPYRPVEGSVAIEDGRCCAGGTAGEIIDVYVAFGAYSPLAQVTEMRLLTGAMQFEEDDMVTANWEPFVTSKRLPIPVALNWTGYHVSVQYRDAAGHQSRVFHDDIAIEGHAPRPTP